MYPLGSVLSIKYPLTVILSTINRNVPVIIVLLRENSIMKNIRVPLRAHCVAQGARASPFENHCSGM